jgi:hypothetical protein
MAPHDAAHYRVQVEGLRLRHLKPRWASSMARIPVRFRRRYIEQTKKHLGSVENPKRQDWGFHVMIPAWRADSKGFALAHGIESAFDAAVRSDIAFHITVENLEWATRPDLWNYNDPAKPGYNPENIRNVEWMNWKGTPHPHRYRDWGYSRADAASDVLQQPDPLALGFKPDQGSHRASNRGGIERLKR